jgi:Family of unknown function (DUF6925)
LLRRLGIRALPQECRRRAVTSAEPLLEFLDKQLKQAETVWSVGSFGATAEFMRDPDEAVSFDRSGAALSAVTARGGVRVSAQTSLRPIASESPTAEAWNHRVALCLPRGLCGMNNRRELTEIGPDTEALRAEDRDGILFDLGLGLLQADTFVRTTDPAVVAALRRHVGKSVFATDSGAMAVILHASPHRVFVSRVGRVEVFQPIPPPDGKSPSGPHTHVLPKLLAHGRTHPATEPLPSGWVPCAYCYPPNPVRDGNDRRRPFDAESHFASLAMLERYGDPERLMLKKRLIYSVMAGEEPFAITRGNDRFDRATVRVTLRQLQASVARSATLAAWLAAYGHGESTCSDVPPESTRPRVSVVQSDGK